MGPLRRRRRPTRSTGARHLTGMLARASGRRPRRRHVGWTATQGERPLDSRGGRGGRRGPSLTPLWSRGPSSGARRPACLAGSTPRRITQTPQPYPALVGWQSPTTHARQGRASCPTSPQARLRDWARLPSARGLSHLRGVTTRPRLAGPAPADVPPTPSTPLGSRVPSQRRTPLALRRSPRARTSSPRQTPRPPPWRGTCT
mmetsp:Transcript_15616/g.59284  ORF Transcript_15616/g.59284 Transcript_15616/m.59284 type:complete len:202 (-) Transcript_15616:1058-1663(-)